MKKCIFVFLFMATITGQSMAEIWLMNNTKKSVYVGPPQTSRDLGINVLNVNGLYLLGKNNEGFAQLCLCADKPRIAGTNDTVYFKRPFSASSYNNVYVGDVEIHTPSYLASSVSPTNSMDAIMGTRALRADGRNADGIPHPLYSLDMESLREYIPEAVVCLDDSAKGINPTAVIPCLVGAIRQLDGTIKMQQKEIDRLKELQAKEAMLSFENSALHYTIPSSARSAWVQLCDDTGTQTAMVDVTGTSSMHVDSALFPTQKGYCTLIVDDNWVCTRNITF